MPHRRGDLTGFLFRETEGLHRESQDSSVIKKMDSAMSKCSSLQKQSTLSAMVNEESPHYENHYTVQSGTPFFYDKDIATMH